MTVLLRKKLAKAISSNELPPSILKLLVQNNHPLGKKGKKGHIVASKQKSDFSCCAG